LQLIEGDIHIWCADTTQLNAERLAAYQQLMSVEELTRNQRYRFERDRQRDCLTRALARTVLSEYADRQPADWQFIKGEHGKPEIVNAPLPIRFNLSHTGRWVVCAVSREQSIGIDIEHTERKNDVRAIAEHYFSVKEVEALFQLEFRQQGERFFDYWTLKEAYMKARGEGISLGLGNFSFDLSDTDNITISFGDKLSDEPQLWRFWLLHPPAADHRMALAYRLNCEQQQPQLRVFETVPLVSAEPAAFSAD
jgi:4'-phosphopantetheinyl transferase